MPVSPELIAHTIVVQGLGKVEAYVGRYRQPDGRSVSPLAICYGAWQTQPFGQLVRIQSSCVYGEVFYSLECDCRQQLDDAFHRIGEAGGGVIIYLDQEGRGAGLVAKARGYEYSQDQGVDSFTAYERLGYPVDARDYSTAGRLLRDLGLEEQWVKLITNNPDKVDAVEAAGFKVERVPSIVPVDMAAREYLQSKRARGHLL